MSQTFYSVERLAPPLRNIVEKSFVVPPAGRIIAGNVRKIVVAVGGQCRHRFDNGDSRPLLPGDVLLVPRKCRQHYEPLPGESSSRIHALSIAFDPALLPNDQTLPPLPDHLANAATAEILHFIDRCFIENRHLCQPIEAGLQEIVAQIRFEAQSDLAGFRWRINSLCANLTVLLARYIQQSDAPHRAASSLTGSESQRGLYLVGGAKEYLLQHLASPVNLNQVASHLCVSSEHLARTFKRVTGQSLFAYFRQLRLERAKIQLVDSEKNVSQIASEFGFSSVELFCRNFKRHTGLSPLAYRHEYSGKNAM